MKSTRVILDVSTTKESSATAGEPGQQRSWFWSATVCVAQLPKAERLDGARGLVMGL